MIIVLVLNCLRTSMAPISSLVYCRFEVIYLLSKLSDIIMQLWIVVETVLDYHLVTETSLIYRY